MSKTRSILAASLLAAAHASAMAAPQASIEDFVRHPTYSSAKISPNGEYLAITVDRGEQDVLTVLRTSDLKIVKVNQLPDEKAALRLLFSLSLVYYRWNCGRHCCLSERLNRGDCCGRCSRLSGR